MLYNNLYEVYEMTLHKKLVPEEWEEISFVEIEKEFADTREKLIEVLQESRGY
jgi:hypothetical protein